MGAVQLSTKNGILPWEKVGSDSNYTVFYYDKRGRLVQETIKISGLSEKKLKYFYGLSDRLDSLQYPNSQMIRYNYDDLGRLVEIPHFVDSASSPGFKYEPWGALREIRFDGTDTWLHSRFKYDKLSRDTIEYTVNHTEQSDTIWWGARYHYNRLGQIDTIHSVNNAGQAATLIGTFTYTGLGQLASSFSKSVIDPNVSINQSWSYDNNGKWTSTTLGGITTSFTYANGRGRLIGKTTSGQTTGWKYDAWGNVLYDTSRYDDYSYDYATNSLRKVAVNTIAPHVDSVVFVYDALGRKVKETFTDWYVEACEQEFGGDGGGVEIDQVDDPTSGGNESNAGPGGLLCWYSTTATTYFIWQGDKVVAEYNSDGSLRNNFLYAGGKQIARFRTDHDTSIVFVVSDHLGSLRTFSKKHVQWPNGMSRATDYQPFGAILKDQKSGNLKDDYLYTGKSWQESGGVNLYYYGARWYDPTVGRFLQTDPVGEGTNAYSMSLNNPITGVDHWGLERKSWYRNISRWGGWERFSSLMGQRRAYMESRQGMVQGQDAVRPMSHDQWLGVDPLWQSAEPDASMVTVETITGRNQFTYGYDPGEGIWGYSTVWGFLPEREGDMILTNQYNAVSLSVRVAYYVADFLDYAMLGDPNYNFDDALGFHATLVVGGGMGISAAGGGKGPELSLTTTLLAGRVIESVWRTPDRDIRARALAYAKGSIDDPYPSNWELAKSFYSGDKGDPAGTHCLECATRGQVHGPARMIDYLQKNGYKPVLANDRIRLIDPYLEPELPR